MVELSNEDLNHGLARHQKPIEDPNGYLRHIEEREVVIASEVFDAYARTVDKRPEWLVNPVGGYIKESYLDTRQERVEFRKRLRKLVLPPNAIAFYESLFASRDIIIFRESVLKEEFFLKALPHERFHKAMKRLEEDEFDAMRQAAEELMARRVPLPEPVEYIIDGEQVVLTDERFVQERYYPEKNGFGFYIAAASMNWEEFYTYLAQGEFEAFVEDALASEYPEQYAIFNRLREQCSLDGQ